MAIMNIGLNSQVITQPQLNLVIGTTLANLSRALKAAEELYQMSIAYGTEDYASLGFQSNEISYGIQTPLAAAHDLYLIFQGQTPVAAQPQNYQAQFHYVTGTNG